MENLINLEKQIKSYAPELYTKIVTDAKFKKAFLLVLKNKKNNHIMLFDGKTGMNQFAEIAYSKPSKTSNVSIFEVTEACQNQGYGRFLFELMTAHLDKLGATSIYGEANPTNTISGVSCNAKNSFEAEKSALISIYEKLGCTFKNGNHFSKTWQAGKVFSISNPTIQQIANEMAEKTTSSFEGAGFEK